MTPGDNPGIYNTARSLTVKLDSSTSAALATYRREMHSGRSDEAVAGYLIRDALVGLGVLALPGSNRSKGARRG